MARKGGRGGRGGGSYDSPSPSPGGRGRRGGRGRAPRGHLGFSTGAFGVLGDDSLNNSDAAVEQDEAAKAKVSQTRDERVHVHMEGGGDADIRSDLSSVHVQGSLGNPVHISIANREHTSERYQEHHNLEGRDQGALRSMHCDDKMTHHRLSRMSINSNADEFIFVGGRPSDIRSSHSHVTAIPEIQVNGDPMNNDDLARTAMRSRSSYSISHDHEVEMSDMQVARSLSQFNVGGAHIQIERQSTTGNGFTGQDSMMPSGVFNTGRSRSIASVHSKVSEHEVPIDNGGHQSRPVSRASVRLVANNNNGSRRSTSRTSVNSNMERQLLGDEISVPSRSRTVSSSDLDANGYRPVPQLGGEVSFEYGGVYDRNTRSSQLSLGDVVGKSNVSAGFNAPDSSISMDHGDEELSASQKYGGSSYNFGRSRSVSRSSLFGDSNCHNFNEEVRSRSQSRVDLRPEADELFQEDISNESYKEKGMPHPASRSRSISRASINIQDVERGDFMENERENVARQSFAENVVPRKEPQNYGKGQMLQSGYIPGDYHEILPTHSASHSSAFSHVATDGKEFRLHTHFEDGEVVRSRSSASHFSMSKAATSSSSHTDVRYRPSTAADSEEFLNEFGMRSHGSRTLQHGQRPPSVFGSDVETEREENLQSDFGAGDADIAYHPVLQSRATSQMSIHSNKTGDNHPSNRNGHQQNYDFVPPPPGFPPARISVLSKDSEHHDPTRISMVGVSCQSHKNGPLRPRSPAPSKPRQQSISVKPSANGYGAANTSSHVSMAPEYEPLSRPSRGEYAISSAHVVPILKLPQRARSLSTNSDRINIGVGFTEMPELYSHPDDKYGSNYPGVKFRPTAEHERTPARPRSTSASVEIRAPPVPAPRTSITSINDIDNIKAVFKKQTSSTVPTPLVISSALTPRVERMSVGQYPNSPSVHNITQITFSRSSTLKKNDKKVVESSQGKLADQDRPAEPTGAPSLRPATLSPLVKPTFNNSFEARGHPAAHALNAMFANRAAKENSNATGQENRWAGASQWSTKTDHNSNVITSIQKQVNYSGSRKVEEESPIMTTPKTSRGPVFKREDRLNARPQAKETHTSEISWKPGTPFKQSYNDKPHEPLKKLPNPTWIVQKSPLRPKESNWKIASGDYPRSPATRPLQPSSQWKPKRDPEPKDKPATATWNAPPVAPTVQEPPKQPAVHASWNVKKGKKPGDTVRQNIRPGQIRNLASMFDDMQAKATEEEAILHGNSMRSSQCGRRTRHNSEPNESVRDDNVEAATAMESSRDDSFIEPCPDRYDRNFGEDVEDYHCQQQQQAYLWRYENAGLEHALSDIDERNLHKSPLTSTPVGSSRGGRMEEEPYYHAPSLQSEDPAFQTFDDGVRNPNGSVKTLAASFEYSSHVSVNSPAQQRRNISHISKASENMRTARELSHHEASSTSRISHHTSHHSNRFEQNPDEPAYSQVNKNRDGREHDYRYAQIKIQEGDYSVIPDISTAHVTKSNNNNNYEYAMRLEEERVQQNEEFARRVGRTISGRYDDVPEDKSVNGQIDNLFGFVDEHLDSDKLMSSREFLASEHDEIRQRKPLTYSMSGYRAIQRNNRRTTSTVTKEEIQAARHKQSTLSQQGTASSRHQEARFSPTSAPNAAELSQIGRGLYGKGNNSAGSAKRLVVGCALATSTPQQSPRGTVGSHHTDHHNHHHHHDMEDTSFVSSIVNLSKIETDNKQQISKLSHCVKLNMEQIGLMQKVLAQARKDAKPIQEMSALRSLLIAKERVALLQREIKKHQAMANVRRAPPPQSRDVKGSLTISNVAIELNRSFYTRTYELNCSYTFIVLFKCGIEVESMAPVTLLANHQNRLRTVHFTEKVNFSNLPFDFCVLLEVYVLALSESKHEDQSCATVFANKCRNLLPRGCLRFGPFSRNSSPDRKPALSPSGFPLGEFQRCGYIQLTRETTTSTKFYLDETEYPLDGTIDIHSRVTTLPASIEVDYRGFLTMYQNISGMTSWERYWAVLRRGTIFFWKYPDDESMEKQPKAKLDLSACTQEQVTPCTPEMCPRPHTFCVNVLVNTAPSLMDKKRLFLSADSRELLKGWLDAVNETLSIIRGA